MSNLHNFVIAIGMSFLVSTAVLLVILQPLKRVLALLCQSGEALPFWRRFTIVMLYAVPLFFSALWTSFHDDAVFTVRTALVASLFGMIGGLAIIGFKVATAKPR
jgi:hypothetical protein